MNQKPLRPCSKIGCRALSRTRYCQAHTEEQAIQTRNYDRFARDERTVKFYSSGAWRKLRDYIKLRDKGLCQQCFKDKRIVVGTEVDHIIPIKVDWSLRLTESNLWLLCGTCHRRKTAAEQGRK